jgi:hypothetical protein
MVWNTTSPDGAQSVKANVPIQQQNTTYTEVTMGNILSNVEPSQDHFWNLDPFSGHHRQVQMPNYSATYSGAPTDPTLAGSMDGSIYLKSVNNQIKGFFKNATNSFQFIPGYLTGTHNVTGTFTNVVALPDNCYGLVWMYRSGADFDTCFGAFKVTGGRTQAFAFPSVVGNSTSPNLTLRYGSGNQSTDLNLKVKTENGAAAVYEYRIMYWGS